MDELKVPKMLKKGDTIALTSISGGRAGDEDMLYRYEIGKRRLEEIWGIHVITTPKALAGSSYLYEHPEARAEDLMWAMKNKENPIRHVDIRVDDQLLRKFRVVCKADDRSANKKLIALIRQCIADFEAAHGTIHPEDKENAETP